MSGRTVMALALGVLIGAAGMWFVDNSEPTTEIDVIEGYSIPSTPNNNTPADNNNNNNTMDNTPNNDMDNNSSDNESDSDY